MSHQQIFGDLEGFFLHVKYFANITPPVAIENGNGQRLFVGNR
jgi:hypothetical protein